MTSIRVVIVDDHALLRQGVRALLSSLSGIEVVGEAADGREAVDVTARVRPDVVLMDLHMAGMDGIEATRRITAEVPDTAVLVVTMLDDDASIFAAMKAGARGYVLKGADQDEVRRAISAVARGEAIFGPTIATRVLQLLSRPTAPSPEAFPQLTERERQVLEHVATGRNNMAISRELGVSPHTVANHVSSILMKLQAADRAEAIIRARDAGLGKSPGR
jgi:DNA-binding NarL/FixJ family response regulator